MLALVFVTACQGAGRSGPSLRPAGSPQSSMGGFPAVSPAHRALLGGMILCLTGSGTAVITGVRPLHPTGTIDVLDFATRPNPLQTGGQVLGTEYGTLQAHGLKASRTVDVPCGNSDSGQGYELALELTVPSGTNAGTTGWEIDYQVGGHTASTTFPEGTVLCSTASIDDTSCKHVWQRYGVSW